MFFEHDQLKDANEQGRDQNDDGTCPSYVYRPIVRSPWAVVLIFMHGLGIRPAIRQIGERLATYVYFVLLPDLIYRSGYRARDYASSGVPRSAAKLLAALGAKD